MKKKSNCTEINTGQEKNKNSSNLKINEIRGFVTTPNVIQLQMCQFMI